MKYELNKTYQMTKECCNYFLSYSDGAVSSLAKMVGTRVWIPVEIDSAGEVEKIKMLDTGKEITPKDLGNDSYVLFNELDLEKGRVIVVHDKSWMVVVKGGFSVDTVDAFFDDMTEDEAKEKASNILSFDSKLQVEIYKMHYKAVAEEVKKIKIVFEKIDD